MWLVFGGRPCLSGAEFDDGDPDLADRVAAAGARAGERWWRLPLPDDLRPAVRSDVAVLRVTNSFPVDASWNATGRYSGWMPSLMGKTFTQKLERARSLMSLRRDRKSAPLQTCGWRMTTVPAMRALVAGCSSISGTPCQAATRSVMLPPPVAEALSALSSRRSCATAGA